MKPLTYQIAVIILLIIMSACNIYDAFYEKEVLNDNAELLKKISKMEVAILEHKKYVKETLKPLE
jgi:hypothetical protein